MNFPGEYCATIAMGLFGDSSREGEKDESRAYSTPLVRVIRAACEKCPGDIAYTDQEKCIKCMKCVEVCPYVAITRMQRPCAEACGVDAIDSDEDGYARIIQQKCVIAGYVPSRVHSQQSPIKVRLFRCSIP